MGPYTRQDGTWSYYEVLQVWMIRRPKPFCAVGACSFLHLSATPHREEKERLREREGKYQLFLC
jgi:hypothetical protein